MAKHHIPLITYYMHSSTACKSRLIFFSIVISRRMVTKRKQKSFYISKVEYEIQMLIRIHTLILCLIKIYFPPLEKVVRSIILLTMFYYMENQIFKGNENFQVEGTEITQLEIQRKLMCPYIFFHFFYQQKTNILEQKTTKKPKHTGSMQKDPGRRSNNNNKERREKTK